MTIKWTVEERLELIEKISVEAIRTPDFKLSKNLFMNYIERIHVLTVAPPGFIENNKARIVGGNK